LFVMMCPLGVSDHAGPQAALAAVLWRLKPPPEELVAEKPPEEGIVERPEAVPLRDPIDPGRGDVHDSRRHRLGHLDEIVVSTVRRRRHGDLLRRARGLRHRVPDRQPPQVRGDDQPQDDAHPDQEQAERQRFFMR